MLALLTLIFIVNSAASSAMADNLRLEQRSPPRLWASNFNDNFFDPEFALEVYRTIGSYRELGQKFDEVGPQKSAYVEWRRLWSEDRDQALKFLEASSESEKFTRIFDLQRLYRHWHDKYIGKGYLFGGHPNFLLSFENWAADYTPTCEGKDPPIHRCAPIPDWRTDEEKAADAASLEKGDHARATWSSGPCKEIWDNRETGSMQARKPEWEAHDCYATQKLINYQRDPDR